MLSIGENGLLKDSPHWDVELIEIGEIGVHTWFRANSIKIEIVSFEIIRSLYYFTFTFTFLFK